MKKLLINKNNIIGEVDLSQRAAVLPFVCFEGFSMVDESLVNVSKLTDLRGDIKSALMVGYYIPGGVCLPVYPLHSKNGLVVYQVKSPNDSGLIEAHQKHFNLNSVPETLGMLGIFNSDLKFILKSSASSLCKYDIKVRARKLTNHLESLGLVNPKISKSKNDSDLTWSVLFALGISESALLKKLVK